MPKWVGRTYAQLWAEFHDHPFSFEETKQFLQDRPVPNLLSELKRAQSLFICGRDGRKRIYRLVPPTLLVDASANRINLGWLKQGFYANLLLNLAVSLLGLYKTKLASHALFGSLARNTAIPESDLDLLVILDDLPEGMGARLRMLSAIQEIPEIRNELRYLNDHQFFPRLSFHPFKPQELEITPFFVDTSFDLKIFYDRGTLAAFIRKIQDLVHAQNIERKKMGKEGYYLDMHIPFGEVPLS